MPTTVQIADILFKKQLGLGTTSSGKQFFSEPIRGRSFVVPSQFWGQADQIPYNAPTGFPNTGVVQRVTGYVLTQVVGVSNAFSGALLQNAIPFNWGDGTGYNYAVYDSTSNPISFGTNDWTVDTEAGILMFNSGIPANMPPSISFYRYSGTLGINSGAFITTSQTGQFYAANNPSGYITAAQVSGTGVTYVAGLTANVGVIGGGNISISTGTPNNLIISGATGTFITTGVTGQFYASNNPSGFVTSGQLGGLNTGSFITTGQTGQFAPDVELIATGATLSGQTVGLSGQIVYVQGLTTNLSGQTQGISGQLATDIANLRTTGANLSGIILATGFNLSGQTVGLSGQIAYVQGLTTNLSGQTQGISGQVATVASNLAITGANLSGSIIATGYNLSGQTVGLSGQIATIIARTGGFVTTAQTGAFITSGYGVMTLYPVTGFSGTTGTGYAMSGNIILSGAGNVIISASGNTIVISGSGVSNLNTGAFIVTGQTGQFYASNNPSGFITSGQLGGLNTGSFITTGQTGQFAPDVELLATGATLSGQTYGLSGQIAYVQGLTTNLSGQTQGISGQVATVASNLAITGANLSGSILATGFNLSGQTANLQSQINTINNKTGVFIMTGQTGQFYAANNPSGFVTSGQLGGLNTGSFITTGQTGRFVDLSSSQTVSNKLFTDCGVSAGAVFTMGNGASLQNYVGTTILNPNGLQLGNADGYIVDFSNYFLFNSSLSQTLDWNLGQLLVGLGNITLDWNNRVLSGNWSAQRITISGNAVLTGVNTGSFVTSGALGGLNTGSFITTGQTGQFYVSNNPSGFLTGVSQLVLDNPAWLALRKADKCNANHVNRYAWNKASAKLFSNHDLSILRGGFGHENYWGNNYLSGAGLMGWTVAKLISEYGIRGVNSYNYPLCYSTRAGNVGWVDDRNYYYMPHFQLNSGGAASLVVGDINSGLLVDEYWIDFVADSGHNTGHFAVLQSIYSGGTWQPYTTVPGLSNVSANSTGTNQYWSGVYWKNAWGPYKTQIMASGQADASGIRIIEFSYNNSTKSGLFIANYQNASAGYSHITSTGGIRDSLRSGIFSHWKTDLLMFQGGQGISVDYNTTSGDIKGFYGHVKQVLPQCNIVIVGLYPQSSAVPQDAIDTQISDGIARNIAIQSGYSYFDAYNSFVDYNSWFARGFGMGDGVHPSLSGAVAFNNIFDDWMDLTTVVTLDTGVFVVTSQTGQFYASNNPSGFVSSGQLGGLNTGSFITTGQTGQFATSGNLVATGATLTGQTIGLSGQIVYVQGLTTNLSGQTQGISGQLATDIGNLRTTGANLSGIILATGLTLSGQTVGLSGQIVYVQGLTTNLSGQTQGISGQLATDIANLKTTGANLSGSIQATGFILSGIDVSLQNQINTINNKTGVFVMTGETRNVLLSGFTILNDIARLAPDQNSQTTIVYPNVGAYSTDIPMITGALVFNTPVARTENRRISFLVQGGDSSAGVDTTSWFRLSIRLTGTQTGNIDGISGAVISANLIALGDNTIPKWAGINKSGNVAIVLGTTGYVQDWTRYMVDVWIGDNNPVPTNTGWGWTIETGANFGFKDLTGLVNSAPFLTGSTSSFVTTGQTGRFVDLTSNQTINGFKTFGNYLNFTASGPIVAINNSTPTLSSAAWGFQLSNGAVFGLDYLSTSGNGYNWLINMSGQQLGKVTGGGTQMTLDWYNRVLSGTWTGLNGLVVSGQAVTTGGPYYPWLGNPSGFVTSGQLGGLNTGAFVVTGQTGAFASSVNLTTISGNLGTTGANLSGIILATGLTLSGQTVGLSGQIVYVQNLTTNLSGQTLGISGQVATVASNLAITGANLSGALLATGLNLSGQTVGLSGQIATIIARTGGFVTTAQTGNLVDFYSTQQITGSKSFASDVYINYTRALTTGAGYVRLVFTSGSGTGAGIAERGAIQYIGPESTFGRREAIEIYGALGPVNIISSGVMSVTVSPSGAVVYPVLNAQSGVLISGNPVLTGSTASFVTTGQTGQFASSVNLTTISGNLGTTGANLSGALLATGLTLSGQTFGISGQVATVISNLATTGANLSGSIIATGYNLSGQTVGLSGQIATIIGRTGGFVDMSSTQLAISGEKGFQSNIAISGGIRFYSINNSIVPVISGWVNPAGQFATCLFIQGANSQKISFVAPDAGMVRFGKDGPTATGGAYWDRIFQFTNAADSVEYFMMGLSSGQIDPMFLLPNSKTFRFTNATGPATDILTINSSNNVVSTNAAGRLAVSGQAHVAGDMSVTGRIGMRNSAWVGTDLTVSGKAGMKGTLDVATDTIISGKLGVVGGWSTFGNNVNVSGTTTLQPFYTGYNGSAGNVSVDAWMYNAQGNYSNTGWHNIIVIPFITAYSGKSIILSSQSSSGQYSGSVTGGSGYYIVWSWQAAAGANGYLVLKKDLVNGLYYNYYTSVLTGTSFQDGPGLWTQTPFGFTSGNQTRNLNQQPVPAFVLNYNSGGAPIDMPVSGAIEHVSGGLMFTDNNGQRQYLLEGTSVSNYVTLNTDQSIAGTKNFTTNLQLSGLTVATQSWVQAQGYSTSGGGGSASGAVMTTGTQNVSGDKTFWNQIVAKSGLGVSANVYITGSVGINVAAGSGFADQIGGTDSLQIVAGATEFGFSNNIGSQGYMSVGTTDGSIRGFGGHVNTTDGFVMGAMTAHNFQFRTNNLNRCYVGASDGHFYANSTAYNLGSPSIPWGGLFANRITGTSGLITGGGLVISNPTTAFPTPAHLTLINTQATSQTTINAFGSGGNAEIFRLRMDYVGDLNWCAFASNPSRGHAFYVGGDYQAGAKRCRQLITQSGVFIGSRTDAGLQPLAQLYIGGGTTTANSCPIKIQNGALMTNAEVGAIEYNGSDLFFTNNSTIRAQIVTGITGNFVTTGSLVGLNTGTMITSNITGLYFYSKDNPSGFISRGLTGISASGTNSSGTAGLLTVAGTGTVSLSWVNGQLTISGFASGAAGGGGVTSLAITGGQTYAGAIQLSGNNGITWSGSGQTVWADTVRSTIVIKQTTGDILLDWRSGESFEVVYQMNNAAGNDKNVWIPWIYMTGCVEGKSILCAFSITGAFTPTSFNITHAHQWSGEKIYWGGQGDPSTTFPNAGGAGGLGQPYGWSNSTSAMELIQIGTAVGSATQKHTSIFRFMKLAGKVFGQKLVENAYDINE